MTIIASLVIVVDEVLKENMTMRQVKNFQYLWSPNLLQIVSLWVELALL